MNDRPTVKSLTRKPTLTPDEVALQRGALTPKLCRCDNPQTYLDEDHERRCLCGRKARDE